MHCPFIRPVSEPPVTSRRDSIRSVARRQYSRSGQVLMCGALMERGVMSALTLANSLYGFSEVLLSRN